MKLDFSITSGGKDQPELYASSGGTSLPPLPIKQSDKAFEGIGSVGVYFWLAVLFFVVVFVGYLVLKRRR